MITRKRRRFASISSSISQDDDEDEDEDEKGESGCGTAALRSWCLGGDHPSLTTNQVNIHDKGDKSLPFNEIPQWTVVCYDL